MANSEGNWLERWRADLAAAALAQDDRLGRRLISLHRRFWRRYHGLSHLEFLFREIEARSGEVGDRDRLVFATWFHDAIYVTWRKDNEARSAVWAAEALGRLGADAARTSAIERLVRSTANHANGGADHDDELFLDMDCAILGAPTDLYARYAKDVRREYWWVPGKTYQAGRRAFLESQLAREPLFLTETYEARYGASARENMRAELAAL